MSRDNEEVVALGGGFILGVIIILGISSLISNSGKTECAKEHNIYECKWIVVPVIPEEKS